MCVRYILYNKTVSSTYCLCNIGLNNSGQLLNHNFSLKHIKIFMKVGPKGLPMPNPSVCWYCWESKKNPSKFDNSLQTCLTQPDDCTARIHKERAPQNINSFSYWSIRKETCLYIGSLFTNANADKYFKPSYIYVYDALKYLSALSTLRCTL